MNEVPHRKDRARPEARFLDVKLDLDVIRFTVRCVQGSIQKGNYVEGYQLSVAVANGRRFAETFSDENPNYEQ